MYFGKRMSKQEHAKLEEIGRECYRMEVEYHREQLRLLLGRPERKKTRVPRPVISKTTRFRIFERDTFACHYCGARPPMVALVLDHVRPVVRGGVSEDSNLVTACQDCNQAKAARLIPTEAVP